MDEKEQAWLRLKAFELVGEYGDDKLEKPRTLGLRLKTAEYLYQWAVTGESP